jgi:HEAT repeat protein
VGLLIPVVKEKDGQARILAVVALGRIGKDAAAATPELTAALGDGNPEMRMFAAKSLGRFGPAGKSAKKALQEALKDKEPFVREAAAEALRKVEGLGDE